MKNKHVTIKYLAIFFACIIGLSVLLCFRTFHTFGNKATADNGYLKVYQDDLTCTKSANHETVYRIYITYNHSENKLPHTGYSDYKETNVSLQTDDSDTLQLKAVEGNGTNKFILAISLTDTDGFAGYLNAETSLIIIPKGTTFTPVNLATNGYSGICFAENIILEKSGTSWKMADCTTVEYMDDDTKITENVALNGSFVLPSATGGTASQQYLGWEIEDKLYPVGARITTADILADNVTVITAKAVYLEFALSAQPSIRFGNILSNSGISFNATISKTSFAAYGKYVCGVGIIVMPSDLLQDDKPFLLENYNAAGQAKNFFADASNVLFSVDDTFFTYRASIVNLLPSNYRRNFSARAYLRIEYASGIEYVWNDVIAKGNPYDLANAILQSGKTLTGLEKDVLNTYTGVTA